MKVPRGRPRHADLPTSSMDAEAYLAYLGAERFTGAVRLRGESNGCVLLIDGRVCAAVYDDIGGMEGLEGFLGAAEKEGNVDVLEYSPERADLVFVWYKEVHGYSEVEWEPHKEPQDVVIGVEALKQSAIFEISREIGDDFIAEVRAALKPRSKED